MLEIKDLTHQIDKKILIEHVSIQFEQGKRYLISGVSGCGKSTLAYLLSGLYPIQEGCITWDSQNISVLDCSMMFQNPNLQFCMDTVFHELIFVLENINCPVELMEQKVNEALIFVEMEDFKHHPLQKLSGGQKQRIALACIYLLESSVIVLDEPFASLDKIAAKNLLTKIYQLQKQRNSTLIIIDHLLELYVKDIDGYYLFQDKQIQKCCYQDLYHHFQKEDYHQFPTCSEVLLEVNDLSIKYDDRTVLEHCSFYVNKQEIVHIDGPSGCGKSSLLHALIGLIPYQGVVLLEGKKYKACEVGFLFQNPMEQFIYPSVYDEVFLSCKDALKTEKLLQQMSLWQYKDLSPFQLSQGQQRRLALTILFSVRHRILLLDEPTYGQDRIHAVEIMNLIVDYAKENQSTVVLTSHDGGLMEHYATRRVILGV